MKNKLEKIFYTCLQEMCNRVGEKDFNNCIKHDAEFNRDQWLYDKYSWSKEAEESFRKWMYTYLKKKFRTLRKKQIEDEITMFIFDYGWTYKKES